MKATGVEFNGICCHATRAFQLGTVSQPTRRNLYARFMEAYAGFFEHTDYEIGRLIGHLKENGLYDNTIFK